MKQQLGFVLPIADCQQQSLPHFEGSPKTELMCCVSPYSKKAFLKQIQRQACKHGSNVTCTHGTVVEEKSKVPTMSSPNL